MPPGFGTGNGAVLRVVPEGKGKAACGAPSKLAGCGRDGEEPMNVEGCGCGGECASEAARQLAIESDGESPCGNAREAAAQRKLPLATSGSEEPETDDAPFPEEIRSETGVLPRSTGAGVQAYLSSSAGNSCLDWSDEGFFCAKTEAAGSGGGDDDIESDDIAMLVRAYDLINTNIDYVEDYYILHAPTISSHCHVTRLTGGDWAYPKTMIYETRTEVAWNAANLYGSRYMLIDWMFLKGASNLYNGASNNTKKCAVMGLARLIVHETAHGCWAGENFALLVSSYFGRRYVNDRGLDTDSDCCARKALSRGYDEPSYFGRDVGNDPYYAQSQDDGDDPPRLTCAGPGA